jgi:hypothetical protein
LIKDKGLACRVLFDGEGKNSEAYGIRALPVAYLTDATGVVVWEGVMANKKEAKPDLEDAIKGQIEGLKDWISQEDLARRLDDLIPRLASEKIAERSAAQTELSALVDSNPKTARPLLKSRMATATDTEVRHALRAAYARLPALELQIELEREANVDRPLALKVRIRNVSDENQTVVRSLDGSDAGARHPRFLVEIVGPDGKREDRKLDERKGDLRSLTPGDFILLAPRKEVDPFGDGGCEHGVLKSWRPPRAGRYRMSILIDYTERNIGHWMGTAAMKDSYLDTLERLVDQVPRLQFEGSVEFEVK